MFPIQKYADEILQGIRDHKASIISVPTASGKSILLTYLLAQEGYGTVYVTVPRRLIAESLKKAVKDIFNFDAGLIMRGTNINNKKLCFITQQSFVNRYYNGKIDQNSVLVIDEAHETKNLTEILRLNGKSLSKVVLLSATINTEEICNYYEDCYSFVLEEERKHQIEEVYSDTPFSDAVSLYSDKRVLIGVSGEDEYKQYSALLPKHIKTFYVHGKMEDYEKEQFNNFQDSCIIFATDVAMSGITIPNLDVVVPPMFKNDIVNNTMKKVRLSLSEIKQWSGRVGRQKDGVSIMDKMVRDTPSMFLKYPEPEIKKGGESLQKLLLLLSVYGINSDDLMNRPDESIKNDALEMLKRNGLLDESGKPTEVGLFVLNNDMSIEEGMLVYAGQKLGIENTARKIGAVINAGNPYRKAAHYPAYNTFVKTNPFNFSQHYAVVSVVENTDLATNVIEDAKQYNFYYKGVKMLKKQFSFIDEKFEDYVELTDELLKTLFRTAMPDNQCTSMRNGYMTKNGVRIVDGYANSRAYSSTGYVSLSPVPLRNAILSSLFTYL